MSYLNPYIHLEALTILAIIFLISMKFRFIDRGGVVTSFIVGYIIYVFGGRVYFLALLTFYLVSVAFTKIRVRRVKEVENKEDGVRGWRNVLANGLTATATAVASGLSAEQKILFAAYLGALSSAFADTLATEIGLLYPRMPRLIINMKKVKPGTPGAVTYLGYMGGLIGMTTLTLISSTIDKRLTFYEAAIIIYSSGLVGMTIDSILGATVQAKYRCRVCSKNTESSTHCGSTAEIIEGVKYINTHTVNLIATIIGAIVATIILEVLNTIK
ncbi:MAG: DUF92 domain-containing protein [Thaumarchaeota archaeon]|nr:DUF92 domain-containing protein [Candidatus Geocrenenecus arthurdayi]MCL7389249.1 DUF92 domain-containing protein [Candidatus Geocrenenecus arthurdayi]MCL7391931.1 DUF92 domain-containing protein [Candidatus Geocrenenecus arthurdayi]MCL7397335.1 DUF92 domain-containing protein [Candidatus Geocrenenecus arthurdayi]MCL7402194.1 DUF92 domain-containing protein [Candidatus Geocrenenecus arthurdayi]